MVHRSVSPTDRSVGGACIWLSCFSLCTLFSNVTDAPMWWALLFSLFAYASGLMFVLFRIAIMLRGQLLKIHLLP